MKFIPHGKLSASIENNIFIIDGTGPWNKEALEQASREFSALHQQLYGTKWGVLVLTHGDPIHTPDASHLLIDAIKTDKRHGRISTALVVKDCDDVKFAKIHIRDIYHKAGENLQFFENEQSAKHWLQTQLSAAQ
ncbi:hypothetical protein [Thalassomonas sp. RHCl1]|uniref:hypothetical protein n=1 Tax=Thalassomonas sp. RHCl1 TaxID=2995320 RepID=UPI00248B4016|nr:hypothetical protein [Thalassomonas sp. RHCl1]